MAFQFDISGWVDPAENPSPLRARFAWRDLDPFTQGYGAAAAQELYEHLVAEGMSPEAAAEAVAFSNWAPETLARIMEDCARILATHKFSDAPDEGREFYAERQRGVYAHLGFPPQTPYLGDDGKVDLREGGVSKTVSHTPGPWHVKGGDTPGFKTASGGPGIYAEARPSDNHFILMIAEMETNVPERERVANARLIAAAPDLLEALKTIVAAPNKEWAAAGGVGGHPGFEAANAAIFKAEGEAA